MTKTRRLTVFMAVGAVGLGAALAAPAFAHEEGHGTKAEGKQAVNTGDKAEARKAAWAERRAYRMKLRKAKREARQALRTCKIHPDKMVKVEESRLLTLLKSRFDAKVAKGDWTAEKAEVKLARVQKRITIRSAMKTARWTPMLKLFGAESRKDLRKMIRGSKSLRSLMKDNGVTRAELRNAVRAGKLARYTVVAELCRSGHEAEPKAEESDSVEKEPATTSA
jgi:hypothetical protein